MRILLFSTIVAVTITFGLNQLAFAVCVEGPANNFVCNTNPPNPDPTGVQQGTNNADLTVNVLPGAGIDTIPANGGNGGDAIDTGNGNDQITATDADLAGSECISTRLGNDIVNITRSTCFSTSTGIRTSTGTDMVDIVDTDMTTVSDSLDTGTDDDMVNISGSTLFASNNDAVEDGRG